MVRGLTFERQEEVVDDGPKPGTHEESDLTDLTLSEAGTPVWGQIERVLV